MVKTNDLKRGCRVQLRNGWYATIMDNMRGDTRVCDVEGFEREMGSVYSHDITRALICGRWENVQHTPKQLKLRQRIGEIV